SPDWVTQIRGNYESGPNTLVYGFHQECFQKYATATVSKACCPVFDFIALEIRSLGRFRVVSRAQEIPHEGACCDLVWSDPDDEETWAVSPRGARWLFSDKVADEFCHVNGLTLIARAHQLVNE
ncbi:hypothetical protein CDV57_09710, partial [Aspergillus fumigatus]